MGIVPQRATTKFHLKVKFGSFVSNILINLARRMERVPNSFGSTSHVHLVRSPLRSD